MSYQNNIEKGKNISVSYYLGRFAWFVLRWYLLISIAFVILYPLVYMVSMAFRSPADFFDVTVVWIPKHFTFDNFRTVLFDIKITKPLLMTAFISIVSTVIQIMVTAMTGYGLARFRFRGNGMLTIFAVVTIMIPTQMVNLPNYLIMKNLDFFGIIEKIIQKPSPINLLNSPLAFIIPALLGQGLMSGVFVLIFRQFFLNLPTELEEAATIDGCGYFGTFLKVMLPNASTALIVSGTFSLVWYWTDYQGPFVFLSTVRTLAVELMNFDSLVEKVLPLGQNNAYYFVPLQQAACIISIFPLLVTFLFLQRFFVQGVERSGIVG